MVKVFFLFFHIPAPSQIAPGAAVLRSSYFYTWAYLAVRNCAVPEIVKAKRLQGEIYWRKVEKREGGVIYLLNRIILGKTGNARGKEGERFAPFQTFA